MDILKFGDIFMWKEQEYVFLHLTSEFLFAAKIFDLATSKHVNASYEKAVSTGRMVKAAVADAAVYSFVVLTTDEFKDRIAHFLNTNGDNNVLPYRIGMVNDRDLKAIKQEILSDKCPVAKVVKEYIQSL